MEIDLKDKVALVIASSQGLGYAVAKRLAEANADVIITSRNEAKLQQVANELSTLGSGKIIYQKADITNQEQISLLFKVITNEFGKLDILVNNAGGPPAGTFENFEDSDWQQAFELNLLSYVRIIRHALPLLRKHGGKIINLASTSVKEPITGLILSNTFRAGVAGLSKSLAGELAPHNILVNTVAPGRIATDRITYLDNNAADKLGITREQLEEKIKESIPLKRYGNPDEFANVVAFLASNANTYMTGSTFYVDGGMVKSL